MQSLTPNTIFGLRRREQRAPSQVPHRIVQRIEARKQRAKSPQMVPQTVKLLPVRYSPIHTAVLFNTRQQAGPTTTWQRSRAHTPLRGSRITTPGSASRKSLQTTASFVLESVRQSTYRQVDSLCGRSTLSSQAPGAAPRTARLMPVCENQTGASSQTLLRFQRASDSFRDPCGQPELRPPVANFARTSSEFVQYLDRAAQLHVKLGR